jgi:hydroxymethylglutaryl-CoA lyase
MTHLQNPIKIIECPRDAMQGWKAFIPTEQKIAYINSLLKVGFDTIDFGSFVSAKAIPQMADTKEVIPRLDLSSTSSKLLAIIANVRGAEEAAVFNEISYLGFPFSISPTFQMRNANSSIEQALERVLEIQNICISSNKTLVVYISMGFGNPYGDPYSEDIVLQWVDKLVSNGISIISLADTVGLAKPEQISSVLNKLIPSYPDIEIGVHLHSTPAGQNMKLEAALNAGCKRFDGALKGIGGCPMANDDLVGNMNTEMMIDYFEQKNIPLSINKDFLQTSLSLANNVFL